ncbi:MAG: hypothetical protein LBJ63_08360 [Prevotellaceae bacterium]|jgi:hypothetical protein|nr:hypothetical protein [Prevotellaceae bacterium]
MERRARVNIDGFYHRFKTTQATHGMIEFYNSKDEDLPFRRLEFWDGWISELSETMTSTCSIPMLLYCEISPATVRYNKSLVFQKNWYITDINQKQVKTEKLNQEIIDISWISKKDGTDISSIYFKKSVDLKVTTKEMANGGKIRVQIFPKYFTPYDSKYIYEEHVTITNNEGYIRNFTVDNHWPLVAKAIDEENDTAKESKELKIEHSNDGAGFQYYKKISPDKSTWLHIVEIDLYVIVTTSDKDSLNYRADGNDIERLKGYLEENFNPKHKGTRKYMKDEDGINIEFVFNLKKYPVNFTIRNESEFIREINTQSKFKSFRNNNQFYDGKYKSKYNRCEFVARVKPSVGNEGGTAGNTAGGLIRLGLGNHNRSSELLDKQIVHEIIHAFYGYDNALVMGNSTAKHSNKKLGDTGALAYGTKGQQEPNENNINKIIETVPWKE